MSLSLAGVAVDLYPWVLILASFLGAHGYRTGSLSPSGAVAASVLGYVTLANPLRVFGVCLLAFYFAGSRATKVKAEYKLTLEEEEDLATNDEDERNQISIKSSSSSSRLLVEPNIKKKRKAGGNRSAIQVACNAWLGSLCALTWRYLHFHSKLQGHLHTQETKQASCVLILGAVAFWGACAGDTFASELGILSKKSPILVTTFKPVPPGTNGGISTWGTFASLLGGTLIGALATLDLVWFEPSNETGLHVLAQCSAFPEWCWVFLTGTFSGVGGSMIDSLLGATLQESLFSVERTKIVHSKRSSREPGRSDESVKSIAGSNVLSNNAVNLISSGSMAAIVMVVVTYTMI